MDPNLLKITTIPISIEVNVTNAQFKAQEPTQQPRVNIQRTQGGYKMESEPIKINIDTYAARKSMGYGEYNNTDFNRHQADKGWKIAYEGVARIVDEGDELMKGSSPMEIAAQQMRAGASIESVMEFLPKSDADISFDNGKLSINYTPSDMNMDWENLSRTPVEFIPGSIEFIVKERPSIEIEYTGGPIYVPASANPNYEPIFDTKG